MTMNRHKSIAVLLCAAALASCDYEKNAVQEIAGPLSGAGVRFFNFGVLAPTVNFYANDMKMTAILVGTCTTLPPTPPTDACIATGAESTNGVAYGGVGSSGSYSSIEPGPSTLTGRISTTVDKDLPISSLAATLEDGKKYSFYQSGLYNSTTKAVDAFIVEDPLPAQVDWNAAQVRFVHAIYNANPMTLYAKDQLTGVEVAIGGEIGYKAAGAFTALPFGVYDLSTRYAGASTNALTRTGVSFIPGTVYSITARGDITVAATTTACAAANRTCLDNTLHR
jgi:hypothetical protein